MVVTIVYHDREVSLDRAAILRGVITVVPVGSRRLPQIFARVPVENPVRRVTPEPPS